LHGYRAMPRLNRCGKPGNSSVRLAVCWASL
jgi:hypothetical protein